MRLTRTPFPRAPIVAVLALALATLVACGDDSNPPRPETCLTCDAGPTDGPAPADAPTGEQGPATDTGAGEGPAPDAASSQKFSFFVYGDTRTNQSIVKVNVGSMAQLDPSAVAIFNGGDITADGKDSQWQTHMSMLQQGSSGTVRTDVSTWTPGVIRYVGVMGNHDVHDGDWYANWNNYLSGQKNLGVNSKSGIYFALTYKNALFLVLDSQHPSSAQTTWLENQLSNVDPSIQWKFALFHHPVYPCNYKSPWSDGIEWVRLFEKHGVDIAFVAHSHTYERTCQMVGGKCQQGGVIYLNSSGGAAPTRDVDPDKSATAGTDAYKCTEILDKGIGNWLHYCHFAVDGASLTLNCYSHDSTTGPRDTFTLTK